MCRCGGNAGTILNALRVALRINSGRIIYNRAMPDSLRAVRHCIFTGVGVVEESGICSAGFLRKHPRCGERASPLRLLTAFASISPKGRALGSPRNVSSSSAKCVGELKASPGRGKLSPQVTDEGAGQQHFALNTPHPALRATCSPFCRCATFSPGAGEIRPQGVKASAVAAKFPAQVQSVWERWHGASRDGEG